MKKFLSMLLSVLVLFQSVSPVVFAQEISLDNDLDPPKSSTSVDDFFEDTDLENIDKESPNTEFNIEKENAGQEQDLNGLITNGGQSRQVLDNGEEIPENDGEYDIQNDCDENGEVDLIISEVFFDGNDEWIEIYNDGNKNFSGNIVITGLNKTINISNAYIGAKDIIIVGNSMGMILDHSKVIKSGLGIIITDTKAINIKLLSSGAEIDHFYIETGDVKKIDNKKTSFQRLIDTREIIPSTIAQNFNIADGYIANPGIVYSKGEVVPSENPDTTTKPDLKITEIYFDGDENWFEITNIGTTTFEGELQLSGNLNFSFDAEIPVGASIVYANAIYGMFQRPDNIVVLNDQINFENEEINLDLIWSGELLDNFFVDPFYVNKYQDRETSFEKVGEWQNWTTTVVGFASDRYHNTRRGIAANPTKYFTGGENLIDVTKNKNPPIQESNLPIDCDDFWNDGSLDISEVYYGTGIYPSYVEILLYEKLYPDYKRIKLAGSALKQEVTFNTRNMNVGSKILLSNTGKWYDEGWESISNPNFALNNSGWLIVYGDDGDGELDVLDIVYLDGGVLGKSLYMGTKSLDCAGVFDYHDKFSPGMNIGQAQYLQLTSEPIVQYIEVLRGGGGNCPEGKGFNTNNVGAGDIQISSIKHFGDLQILKLKNKSKEDISLRDYSLQGFDGEIVPVKGNTLFAKETMSFVGRYGFPSKDDHCVNLFYQDQLIDRYCRNSLTKASAQDEENIANQLSFWIDNSIDEIEELEEEQEEEEVLTGSILSKTIKILHIDYDPPGTDKDNETITLQLLTGTQVDLSKYILQYTKDGKSTNKKLDGILTFGAKQVFKGDYTLPNSTNDGKAVIVNLLDPDKNVVDTYSYNPNKIKEIPDGEYQVLSVIDGDTIKIAYMGQEFNIRLAGIDAPESSALRCGKVECFGPEAKDYLKNILENKTIYFETEQKDAFDRFVGYVFLDGKNINEKLVKDGYAREYSHKGQKYKYQTEFKNAQKQAQLQKIGLWGSPCIGQRLCPVEETMINEDYVFTIDKIVYDPPGTDAGKEEITITMHQGFAVQFSEGFYLMVNDTKKSLKNYGGIGPEETKTLIGTFSFPNSKKTTVSLMFGEIVFDTYEYDPELDKEEEKEAESLTGVDIKITGLIPNPKGKDSLGESVWLLYSGVENDLNLSSGFYLKIANSKKKLSGILFAGQETLITGNFSLPNKAACVEIGFKEIVFDKFCYPQPIEGQKFSISNGILEAIIDEDFDVLRTAKLQNIGNQVCLTYAGQKFYCKNMPYSKLSTKRINQNKLYKEYFDVFENYLKNQWRVMYYNSEIKNYFELLNKIEKVISEGKPKVELDGAWYDTNEFKNMYESQFPSNASNTLKKKVQAVIPSTFIAKYEKLQKEYLQYLSDG